MTEFGIRIKADASGFKGQVGEAKREVEDFTRGTQDASVALASKFGVAIGAAAVAIGGVFVSNVRRAIGALDDLDETSQALGIAADKLSSLQATARAAGVEQGAFASAMARLNAQISDAAAGAPRASALFAAMGISVRGAGGAIKSADEVLGEIADKFKRYKDDVLQSNLATDLFGRGAAKMATYLNEGAEGLTKFSGASQEAITEAARLQGHIDELTSAWDRLWLAIAGRVAGGANAVINFARNPRGALAGFDVSEADAAEINSLVRKYGNLQRAREALQRGAAGGLFGWENDRLAGVIASVQAQQAARDLNMMGDVGGAFGSESAPNVEDEMARRRAAARAQQEAARAAAEAAREEERAQRELQKIRETGYQQAIRDAEQRARELAQMEEQNQAIRNQIEEFGKTEMQVAELRAARLEAAAAAKEQQAAELGLVDGNEARIVQLRAEIQLLRERAQLTRAAGGQAGLARMEREGTEAAQRAAREAQEANREMTDDLRRGLTDALMRGFEGGKGAAENFFGTLGNMIQTLLLRKLSEGLINSFMNELQGGGGSSGGLDWVGDAFIKVFGMHSGGVVGSDASFTRSVPAGLFAGARRYHRGGTVLGPDEVPIIAQRGERVLPRDAAMGGLTVNVINNAGAQVRTESRSEGGTLTLDVIVDRVEAAIAGNMSRGRGSLDQAVQGRFGLRPQAR